MEVKFSMSHCSRTQREGRSLSGLPGTADPNGFVISAVVMFALAMAPGTFFKFKKWI